MKLLLSICLLLASTLSFANDIDVKCPQLTYKTAPVVQADQYICHQEYAVAYSYRSKNPIYTAEFLNKSHTGSEPRTNDFRVDPAIPPEYQASPKDYYHSGTACNGGRCDRGHMTPDQDFSSCAVCVSESFFMSNMVPQNYKNNEVIWKELEELLRKYVAVHPTGIYVITGPAYQSPVHTLGADQVWIPAMLFKVAIDALTGKSIAFYMPNAPEDDLSQFVVNLATIEAATGIKFDETLDKQSVGDFNAW